MNARLKFKVFKSSWDSWDKLCQQAADFATTVGKDNVVNVSHSCCGSNDGTVTIWYWQDETADQMFEINQVNFGD